MIVDLVSLGAICKEIYRYPTYYGIEYLDTGVPEVRGELIIEDGTIDLDRQKWRFISEITASKFPRTNLEEGDLIMSVRGTIGKIGIVPRELCGANITANLIRISPNRQKVYERYLWLYMRSPEFLSSLDNESSSTTIKTIKAPNLKALQIPLPPLPEQRRIADILDRAEALLAKRRAALAQLNELAQSIFVDMFGDPAKNTKDWPRATLGDVILSASDGPHVSPEYTEEGIPFLSTRHVRAGEIIWDDLKFISQEDAEVHWKKCKPERGDILYSKGGTTGLAATVKTDRPFAIWVHVSLLKPISEKVDPVWLESMLNNEFCYQQSQVLTHGIANRDLGLTRMVKIKIFLPPLSLQQEFVRRVAVVEKMKAVHKASLAELDELFASLQYRAFKGEL